MTVAEAHTALQEPDEENVSALASAQSTTVYTSPGYPETPVDRYHQDTRTCAAAVAAALQG